MIPGIEFSVDVQGIVGIGVRGNSANEAVLVLIDGIEMNELLYGSNQFGNHFPIDQIRRIEVIRGPGSVIYGGFAVYAVINIMTKSSEWHNGIRVGQTVGETDRGMARRNFSASIGKIWDKARLSVTGNLSEGNRSDRVYTDLRGNSYNMLDNSRMSSKFLAFNFKTGNFFLKGVADYYNLMVRDNQTDISSKAYPLNFSSFHIEGRYQFKINENFSIAPFLNFRRQMPWETPKGVDSLDTDKVIVYKISAIRSLLGIAANWKPKPNIDVLLGTNVWEDRSRDYFNPDSLSESARYTCRSIYGQGIWKTRFANLTMGLRFDYHSYYKPILSPRIAVNRSFGKWYMKASFNRSFRTPAMSNISLRLGDQIDPQITDYYEAEWGINVNPRLLLTLNLYQISVTDGIVFSVLEDGFSEGYSNAARMGTRGLEAEGKFSVGKMIFQGGYSFYTTGGQNNYEAYAVPEKNFNLAFPASKLTFQNRFQIGEHIKLSNTIIWLSDRYGFNGDEESPGYINYGQVFQWNLFVQAKDVYLKGLSIGAGVYDITNSRYSYIQSYNSGHMPLPAMSREYVLKITYGINLIRNQ
jgi:outer membrane cobalamin receptor